MIKKLIFASLCFLLLGGFYGCQKKSDLQVTTATAPSSTATTPVPDELLHINDDAVPVGSQVPSSNSSQSFILDPATIDSSFGQNYALALEDAQKALRSGVKYCGAKVSFYGATFSETSHQTFYFYSDEFSADYYWAVTLNGYQNNQKTRAFAAKRDLANEIRCMTQAGNAPGTVSTAYDQLTKTDKFKKIDPGTIAQTIIQTTNASWTISVINNAGETVLTNTINPATTIQTDSLSDD